MKQRSSSFNVGLLLCFFILVILLVNCKKTEQTPEKKPDKVLPGLLNTECGDCEVGEEGWVGLPAWQGGHQVHITTVHNPSLRDVLTDAFDTCNVEWDTLEAHMGIYLPTNYLSDSVRISYIDTFSAYAITVDYGSQATESTSCGLSVFTTDGVNFSKPMLTKAVQNTSISHYDLTDGTETKIVQNLDHSVTITRDIGQFRGQGGGDPCSNAIIACITDAYTNHGWTSIILSAVTMVIPAAGVAVIVACIGRNLSICL